MILDVLLDLFFVGTLAAFGWLLTRSVLPSGKFSEHGYLAFLVGAGIFSWILFLLSWIGLKITATTVVVTSIILLGLSGVSYLWVRPSQAIGKGNPDDQIKSRRIDRIPQFLLFGLLILSMALAVGRSYSSWDAIAIWSIKGYGIAREGTLFAGAAWGAHGLSYPQNIPLLIASFKLLGGDLLPGSKLIFPLFYASLIAGCYQFWRHLKIPEMIAGLGALFVASLPVVFEHSTIGYVNLPFATYIVLGCLLAIRGVSEHSSRMVAIGGILFGLACWTRPEGIFLVPMLIIALFIALKISQRQPIRILQWFLPILLIGGVWLVFQVKYGGPSPLASGIQQILQSTIQGQFPWVDLLVILRAILRHALTIKIWGLIFPTAIVMIVLHYRKLHLKSYPQIFLLFVPTIAAGVAMVFFYIIVSLQDNLGFWIATGLDRMFLPFVLLATAWTVLLGGTPTAISAEHTEKVTSDSPVHNQKCD